MGRAGGGPGATLSGLDARGSGSHVDAGDTAPSTGADRTFAAILCAWEDVAIAGASALADRIDALCRAGVHVGIVSRSSATAVDESLRARPSGPGTLHLLIVGAGVYRCTPDRLEHVGRDATDVAGLARWMTALLERLGIGSGLMLVAGAALAPLVGRPDGAPRVALPGLSRAVVAPLRAPRGAPAASGGPSTLLGILDDQVRRRATGRVPDVDHDPAWLLVLPAPRDGADAAVQETLCTVADGRFGTRGSLEDEDACGTAHVVAEGVYTDDDDRQPLLTAPDWTAVDGRVGVGGRRLLDLRTGMLWRDSIDGARTIRFASCTRPGVMVMRVEASPSQLTAGDALQPCDSGRPDGCVSSRRSTRGGGITAAARQVRRFDGSTATVERLACYVADPERIPPPDDAERMLATATDLGFDALLAEQRTHWARRWADALVVIEGDAQAQYDVRFALFHLLSTVADTGEAAVGARGLSGPAYAGHVFWDADTFVLPVMAATRPRAALAMLRYRCARLEAARRRARDQGFAGALWPWESTDDGEDATPTVGRDRHGALVPIRTGEAEHHIVADVAWAACHYAAWSGDHQFLRGAGLALVLEGARFWASRVREDPDGAAHIGAVIGPDEYHELVDDNAFTNVMARWNLRRAADLAERAGTADTREVGRWRAIADALVDGYDPRTGTYEQFAGFSDLTPLIISDIAEPPVAADLLLGREVVNTSQVVKQADVVMLHHLVPDELEPGSLRADLERYAPLTAHGSSLSPAIHAAVWARAGEPDRALDLFRLAGRLDRDDVTGTTAGGLHVATFGGLWQALAHGFLGLRALPNGLAIAPVLPATWNAVRMNVRFRGARVRLRATHRDVRVTTDRPLTILLGPERRQVRTSGDDLVVTLDDGRMPA